jgi:hypothetical protein
MFKSKLIFFLLENRSELLDLFKKMANYELDGFEDAQENLTELQVSAAFSKKRKQHFCLFSLASFLSELISCTK